MRTTSTPLPSTTPTECCKAWAPSSSPLQGSTPSATQQRRCGQGHRLGAVGHWLGLQGMGPICSAALHPPTHTLHPPTADVDARVHACCHAFDSRHSRAVLHRHGPGAGHDGVDLQHLGGGHQPRHAHARGAGVRKRIPDIQLPHSVHHRRCAARPAWLPAPPCLGAPANVPASAHTAQHTRHPCLGAPANVPASAPHSTAQHSTAQHSTQDTPASRGTPQHSTQDTPASRGTPQHRAAQHITSTTQP